MKRIHISFMLIFVFSLCTSLAAGLAGTSGVADAAGDGGQVPHDVQSVLSKLVLSGGISGGSFYTSNPGEDTPDSEFLLSNLLVEFSFEDEALPIEFMAAFGQTSTPSVIDAPENNKTLDIEYAGILLNPVDGLTLEVGLLGPNSGFEDTYTYANRNILLGAVASQQPYNAYGVKSGYETGGFSFWGGYYRDRLDKEEYNSPADAWEIGIGGELAGNDIGFYHYHAGGFRHLTGMVIERTIKTMGVGLNIDYWAWDEAMEDLYDSDTAIGGAVYVCRRFGDVSIPLRFEYIQQDESEIFIENAGTDDIFTVVITPTCHFGENAYARAEASWVLADGGFEDEDGGSEDSNVGLAVEFGVTF